MVAYTFNSNTWEAVAGQKRKTEIIATKILMQAFFFFFLFYYYKRPKTCEK